MSSDPFRHRPHRSAAIWYACISRSAVGSPRSIWSEVDAASRRQHLTRRPAGRSQRDRHHLLDRKGGLREAIRHEPTQRSIRRSEAGDRTRQGRGGARRAHDARIASADSSAGNSRGIGSPGTTGDAIPRAAESDCAPYRRRDGGRVLQGLGIHTGAKSASGSRGSWLA